MDMTKPDEGAASPATFGDRIILLASEVRSLAASSAGAKADDEWEAF
jgi:hypothetical protein